MKLNLELPDEIEIISWNVQKGYELELACAWLAQRAPEIVLWQEMQPGDLHRAENLLGMRGYPAAEKSTSSNDNVVFVRQPGAFVVQDEYLHPSAPWHAPANVTVRLRDRFAGLAPRLLSVVSEHSCYWSANVRLQEADWYTTLAKPAKLALVGGDWNSYPAEDAHYPDWTSVVDQAFRLNRTYATDSLTRRTDVRPDRLLTEVGYVDAARWAAQHLVPAGRINGPLTPTAGYGRKKRMQGGLSRIDRIYLTAALAPAIRSVHVPRDLDHISDHRPVVLTLATGALLTVLYDIDAEFDAHRP